MFDDLILIILISCVSSQRRDSGAGAPELHQFWGGPLPGLGSSGA